MTHPGNPHDRFIREIGSDPENAVGILENFLPAEILRLVDMASIRVMKDSFVDPELRAYYSDLLYRLTLAETPGYVYLLFEHKSRAERPVHLQVLKYMPRIWYANPGEEVPTIIPLIVYHGSKPWPYDPRFSKVYPRPDPVLLDFFPDFKIVLADLGQYTDEELRGAVIVRAALLLLKHIHAPDLPERLPEIFGLLKGLYHSQTGLGHLEAMLRYVVRAAEPVQEKTVEQIVTQLVPENERDRVMATLAEQWIQKGQTQTLLEMIEDGLNAKFGGSGLQLMPEVRKVSDQASLRKIVNSLWNVQDLEQFRQVVSKVKT
ncbi:MAG: Rpn family recombination-promoting nuclease/putative transposase [Desulfococcaceae bacterium]